MLSWVIHKGKVRYKKLRDRCRTRKSVTVEVKVQKGRNKT